MGGAVVGWGRAVGGVLLYDAWLARRGRPTLTRELQEAWETPGGRIVILGSAAFLVSHLAGVIPERLDPLTVARKRIER